MNFIDYYLYKGLILVDLLENIEKLRWFIDFFGCAKNNKTVTSWLISKELLVDLFVILDFFGSCQAERFDPHTFSLLLLIDDKRNQRQNT